ncbi:MAG: ribonuclease protein component, partial [Acidimicrobiaceae bacterium]|nr:ribonuclease protein component [Acidimicrobiaceae bacterium]MDQ1422896.1 ribonuclease protein component [Acidimicrobiaceae bacterium]
HPGRWRATPLRILVLATTAPPLSTGVRRRSPASPPFHPRPTSTITSTSCGQALVTGSCTGRHRGLETLAPSSRGPFRRSGHTTEGVGRRLRLGDLAGSAASPYAGGPFMAHGSSERSLRVRCRSWCSPGEAPGVPRVADIDPDRGGMSEAHVSAEHPASGQTTRISSSDGDPRRSSDPEIAPGQGSSPPLGVIHRVRGRATFRRFRTDARRFHDGPLSLRWLSDPPADPPCVGYAIGRAVGPAVTRNRLRRRLRSLMGTEARRGLPPGAYLLSASPRAATASFPALGAHVTTLCNRVRQGTHP